MNLSWLQSFVAVVEEGSLSRAARVLHLTQPAVSRHLAFLEQHFRAVLLERTARGVNLTPAGRAVYQAAKKALGLLEEARREVAARAEALTGEVALAASTIPGEYVLPPLLGRFQELHPGVRVRLEVADTRVVLEKVRRGEVQLGAVGALAPDKSLRHAPFCRDELVVVVPRGHRFAGRREVDLAEFCAEPLVLREPGSGTRAVLEARLKERGVPLGALRVRLELGSTEAVLNAVAAGLGISLVSRLAALDHASAGKLAFATLSGVRLERDLYLVWRGKLEADRLGGTLLAFLREGAAGEASSR